MRNHVRTAQEAGDASRESLFTTGQTPEPSREWATSLGGTGAHYGRSASLRRVRSAASTRSISSPAEISGDRVLTAGTLTICDGLCGEGVNDPGGCPVITGAGLGGADTGAEGGAVDRPITDEAVGGTMRVAERRPGDVACAGAPALAGLAGTVISSNWPTGADSRTMGGPGSRLRVPGLSCHRVPMITVTTAAVATRIAAMVRRGRGRTLGAAACRA